jgi:hypothetical protein
MTQMAQMSAWHATLGGDAMDADARRLALSHLPTAHCPLPTAHCPLPTAIAYCGPNYLISPKIIRRSSTTCSCARIA